MMNEAVHVHATLNYIKVLFIVLSLAAALVKAREKSIFNYWTRELCKFELIQPDFILLSFSFIFDFII